MKIKNTSQVVIVNLLPTRKVYKPIKLAVLSALKIFNARRGEVVVTLSDSSHLLQLNREFRDIDSTTDVLTFPADQRFVQVLGDVIINWDMAVAQAQIRNVRVVDEAAMLAVHGTLHLLGFDDHNEIDRHKMISAMNKVMASVNLPTDLHWSSLPHEEHTTNA